MLESVRLRGLGVIEDAELELSPGFTVLTGETGAGKTMVVTGLGLLLGGRASAALVRPGARRAVVEGRIALGDARATDDGPSGRVRARVEDAGGELDEGALIVSRTISADGRSRAHVGGSGVPLGVLTDLADDLVAVHGQSDQQRLLVPARQRASLDRYAGAAVLDPLREYAAVHGELREVAARLSELTTRGRERRQEAGLLRFGLAEVEAAAPQAGEDGELAAESMRLGNADALRTAADRAHALLLGGADDSGGADAAGLVSSARRAVEVERAADPVLGALADRLAEVTYLLGDVAGDLASYAADVDVDPLRLAAVEDRRAALTQLTRKYGEPRDGGPATVDSVLDWSERSARRLAELDRDDDDLGSLGEREQELRDRLARLAGVVSSARRAAADDFAAAVTGELADLAMARSAVRVVVGQRPASGAELAAGSALVVDGVPVRYGPAGVDEVEIQLVPFPGAAGQPVQKGASGGELSRVMLAIEVVFAGSDPVPTFVFDEVDAGVGGAAAVEIGRRLARLARSAQVLVVTHLPQVAAFADAHLVVEKSSDGTVTRSGVTRLDDDGRVRELSRMLAGLEESELARAHAAELLENARSARAAG